MKQIAAIPYENGQVFGHYGKTQAFLIATIEAGKLVNRAVVPTKGKGHGELVSRSSAVSAAARKRCWKAMQQDRSQMIRKRSARITMIRAKVTAAAAASIRKK